MAFAVYSSKNAKVRIGGIVVTSNKWTVTPATDKHPATHFESAGFKEYAGGLTGLDVSIELNANALLNYFTAGIRPGQSASCLLYENDTTGPYWSGTLFIETMPETTGSVGDLMDMTIAGSFTGSFTYPTGTAV